MLKTIPDTSRNLVLLLLIPVLSGAAWGPQARAETDSDLPVTLEKALAIAHENSRLMEAARQRVGEAEGDLLGASLLLLENPELGMEAGPRVPQQSPGEASTDMALGLEQTFQVGGQRSHRVARARAQVAAARAQARDVQRMIDLAVARTFYQALAADVRLRLLEQNERLARELFDIALRRLEAGEGTPLEVNTARIRLAEASRRAVAVRTEREAAVVKLAELLGLDVSTPLKLIGELPGDEAAPEPAALVARALEERADLQAAARQVEAARSGAALARAQVWPDIGLGVQYAREEGDEILTAGIRVPIPLFNRNQGERQRARAERARAAAEREALALTVASEVRRAWLVYEQARSAFQIYDAEVLRAQEESLALLRRTFEVGEVGMPEVIVVQREVVEGREGYLNSQLDLALARAELLAAVQLPQVAPLRSDAP